MEILYEIQFDNGARWKATGNDSLNLQVNDYCVIRKDFYMDYAKIVKVYGDVSKYADLIKPTRPQTVVDHKDEPAVIQRKATVVDQAKATENQARGKSALRTAAQHIEQLELPMKLINAHYSYDGKLITIQFSAEGRVDFRELVKQLSTALNTRIELRQIGVRDETAAIGGISPCGRPLCCCSFLQDFASINVKMAKEQDLSLTPSTISGVCGRLKCCLKYEHEGYLEMEKTMPHKGEYCECPKGKGRVTDRNLLTQKVTLQLEDSAVCCVCDRSEIKIIPPESRRKDTNKMEKSNNGGEKRRN